MQDDAITEAGASSHTAARPLNLRQIEVFRAIMMAGSISGAGRLLHVSQPAVSRVLSLTESRLGYPLFERAKSRLTPTPEALRLYAEVEQVYGGIQRVNDLAIALGEAGAGVLRVVCSASYGQRLVPRTLLAMRGRTERSRVDYRSVTFDELAGYFLTGRADVGLSMSPPQHPHLNSVRLGTVPIVCIAPPDHPLASHDSVHAHDFGSAQWIAYPVGTPLNHALTAFFGDTQPCPAAVEVHSPVTACAFVLQGLGPALVDRWCITPELAERVAIRPIRPEAHVEIWATHSTLAPLPLLGRRFLDAARHVIEQGA
ncbi:LysR family transcriptional regulator [Bordetella genomosp. 4]|uniref:LysR family transcriptional regulator n=1 Tax=Bordetella genomosp. 4 TaxID=463044 RepID=A0A261V1M8_9BORD|nr:LysR family transcriptional regulator [Bordetella genomosp. 4]OZI41789.1 LysR family transcriptional regulator [Bordetella genomosp. 4]OZI67717.1 LysR family transcriptional regulator [Bordetella genomosp. 4]